MLYMMMVLVTYILMPSPHDEAPLLTTLLRLGMALLWPITWITLGIVKLVQWSKV